MDESLYALVFTETFTNEYLQANTHKNNAMNLKWFLVGLVGLFFFVINKTLHHKF